MLFYWHISISLDMLVVGKISEDQFFPSIWLVSLIKHNLIIDIQCQGSIVEFLKDGLFNGFPLNATDVSYAPAEMQNCKSATDPLVRDKAEQVIKEEISNGNCAVVQERLVIVSALRAIPKPDSSEVRVIHDWSMPAGKGFNSYSKINCFKFQTLDDAGYVLAKVDL